MSAGNGTPHVGRPCPPGGTDEGARDSPPDSEALRRSQASPLLPGIRTGGLRPESAVPSGDVLRASPDGRLLSDESAVVAFMRRRSEKAECAAALRFAGRGRPPRIAAV